MNTDEHGWEKAMTRIAANYRESAVSEFASIRVNSRLVFIRVHPCSSVVAF
jgi:anti-sigma-K factor RskA